MAAALRLEPYVAGVIPETEARKRFGPQLVAILDGVRRISQLKIGKASLHTENFIRLLIGISKDIRVILLKLAESLYFLERYEQLPAADRCARAREASLSLRPAGTPAGTLPREDST